MFHSVFLYIYLCIILLCVCVFTTYSVTIDCISLFFPSLSVSLSVFFRITLRTSCTHQHQKMYAKCMHCKCYRNHPVIQTHTIPPLFLSLSVPQFDFNSGCRCLDGGDRINMMKVYTYTYTYAQYAKEKFDHYIYSKVLILIACKFSDMNPINLSFACEYERAFLTRL